MLLLDLCPWLYTDFWLVSALQRQINETGWNLLSQSSKKKTIRIVSLWVKAIKSRRWLMRWFESLIKSLIDPNTPTIAPSSVFPSYLLSTSGSTKYDHQLIEPLSFSRAKFTCPWTLRSLLFLLIYPNGGEQPGQDISQPSNQDASSPCFNAS